jgi:hypothetical protein
LAGCFKTQESKSISKWYLETNVANIFFIDVFAEYLSENKSNGKTSGEFYSVAYNQNFRQP